MKKILRIVNSILFIFFICFMAFTLVSSYGSMKVTKLLMTLCIFPLIMVPSILDRIKVYHMDEVLIFLYYLFLLFALVMGCILKFYYKIEWFDLFVHFMSGFMTSVVGFILLQENKLVNKKYKWFGFLFITMFAITIAAGWEYFEFVCDKIFNGDAQWVKETGVDDTMTDMLVATAAGLICSFYYLYYLKKKNRGGVHEKK